MRFHRTPSEAPEINLIPFIDVLLVVLIFLLLTTSYQRINALRISLPTADAPQTQNAPTRLQVSIDAQGQMHLNGRLFAGRTLGDLQRSLNALAPRGSDTPVVIQADAQTAHQRVIDAMTAARMAGLSRIVFAVVGKSD